MYINFTTMYNFKLSKTAQYVTVSLTSTHSLSQSTLLIKWPLRHLIRMMRTIFDNFEDKNEKFEVIFFYIF